MYTEQHARFDSLVDDGGRAPEARQPYLRALVLARAAASERGIERGANAFASLGDAAAAMRARTALEAGQ